MTPEDQQLQERLTADVLAIKKRLDKAKIPARSVAVRSDILRELQTVLGLPVTRTPQDSPARWGILV
jgi:hypothetical protein